MSASPSFSINDGDPLEDQSVSATSAVVCTLDSTAGVHLVEWSIIGVDETTDVDDYDLETSGLHGSTMTTTSGVLGTAAVVRCRINSGVDPITGNPSASMQATAVWWVPTTTGLRVKALGEDSSATVRDVATVNAAVRATDSGGGSGGSSTSRQPCRAATTANIPNLASASVTQDGVTLTAGQRLLVKDQSNARNNGIYVVGTVGGGLAALTRATDFDTSVEVVYGVQIPVSNGTINGNTLWLQSTTGTVTVGTTDIVFRLASDLGAEIALDDTNETLTIANGQRFKLTDGALSLPRVKTLSNAGAYNGDKIYFRSESHDYHSLHVKNAAGTPILDIVGPGLYVAEFDGTAWHGAASAGMQVFNIRDFGALGSETLTGLGPQTESLAIQACIDAAWACALDGGRDGAVVYFPPGRYVITGYPLKMRRTPLRAPIIYRGAGRQVSLLFNQSGDIFQVDNLDDDPSTANGGYAHGFEDLGFNSKGYNVIWDLGDALDEYGETIGDGPRVGPRFNRTFHRRDACGPCVRLRKPTRAVFQDCIVDPANAFSGGIGFEIIRGSASFYNCQGGQALIRCRDANEILIQRCLAGGGFNIPAWDFLHCKRVHIVHTANEGHAERDALYKFVDCASVVLDMPMLATADRSYIGMTGQTSLTGTPTITFEHLDANPLWIAQNRIRRSAGSWFDDNMGYSARVHIDGDIENSGWYTVLEATHDTLWVEEEVTDEEVLTATGNGAFYKTTNDLQPSITFATSDDSITRANGSWIVDGFEVGMMVTTTSPTVANQGPFEILALTATKMTVDANLTNEGPLTGRRVEGYTIAAGVVFRNCHEFKVINGVAEGEFKGALDQSRYAIEVDEDCRNGYVESCAQGDAEPDIFIHEDAYNVVGEYHSTSADPDHRRTIWLGRHRMVGLDIEEDVLHLRRDQSATPSSLSGVSVKLADGNGFTGFWYDPTSGDSGWKAAKTAEEAETTLVSHSSGVLESVSAKAFIGTSDDNTRVIARLNQSHKFEFTTTTLGDTGGLTLTKSGSTRLLSFTGAGRIDNTSGEINIEANTNAFVQGSTAQLLGGGFLGVHVSSAGALINGVPRLSSPATGTGISTNQEGRVRRGVHKRSFTYQAFTDVDGSKAIKFDSLPAKTKVVSVYADTSSQFLGGTVSAASLRVGTEDDDDGYILAHDVFAAPITKGIVDGDLGAYITRAAAVQGGHIPSWTAAKELRVQLDVTGDTLDHLTQGAVEVVVVVEYLG